MSNTPKHYNLATENRASQDCKLELGPKIPKTSFSGSGGAKPRAPMGKGKK